ELDAGCAPCAHRAGARAGRSADADPRCFRPRPDAGTDRQAIPERCSAGCRAAPELRLGETRAGDPVGLGRRAADPAAGEARRMAGARRRGRTAGVARVPVLVRRAQRHRDRVAGDRDPRRRCGGIARTQFAVPSRETSAMMHITGLYAALAALLVMVLAFFFVGPATTEKVGIGTG